MALTHDNLKEDQGIWKRLDEGYYQLVFASPEVLFRARSHFIENTMKKPTKFAKNLVLMAVDEAHMIWDSQGYRPHYPHLGRLRIAFPGVPIAPMSATIAPPTVAYCQKVLNMALPSDCVTVLGRRYNVNILIAEQPSERDLQPILQLLPRRASGLDKMPKIAIFIDDVKLLLYVTYNIRFYIAKLIGGNPESEMNQAFARHFVRTYFGPLQAEKRRETENLIKEGQARIVIATEAMSHGVDFRDISVVLQWGLAPHLTMNSLDQRKGRAARSDIQGIFVLFVPKKILDYCRPNQISETIAPEPQPDPISDADADQPPDEFYSLPYESTSQNDGDLPKERQIDVNRYRVAVENNPKSEKVIRELTEHLYQTLDDKRKSELLDGDTQNRPKWRAIDRIERPILWPICTDGCRNRVFAAYYKYPDVFYDHFQKSWCCCSCAILKKKLDPFDPINAVHSIPLSLSFLVPKPPLEKVVRNVRKVSGAVLKELKPVLLNNISSFINWKRKRFIEKGLIRECVPVKAFLGIDIIEKIVKDVRQVSTLDDLKAKLKAYGCSPSSMLLREKDLVELFSLIETTVASKIDSINPIPASNNQPKGHTMTMSSSEKITVPSSEIEMENVVHQPQENANSALDPVLATAGEAQEAESAPAGQPLSATATASPPDDKPLRSRKLSGTTGGKRKAPPQQSEQAPTLKRGRQPFVDVTNRNHNRKREGLRVIQQSDRLKQAMEGNI